MKNFALIGAAGYVAPRHLKAIHDTGNNLIAALDPNDSVGILDRYFPMSKFFTEPERFDRFLNKRQRGAEEDRIDYVSICSPNYLHDAHIRMTLRAQADAICEKPLVVNPWNLDALEEIEAETGRKVTTVLQLRLHDPLVELKRSLDANPGHDRAIVDLTYITQRGPWYDISWKGSPEKSGGVATNIGIHFFDLCIWLFGEAHETAVHLVEKRRMAGILELERAQVRWFLSVERDDLPDGLLEKGQTAFRSLTIDGKEVEFSQGFAELHTVVYQNALQGKGFTIADARPSVELVYKLRHSEVTAPHDRDAHPLLLS
jgi:UDP-N-acetyl-2-amino-2-deoxyglucuronate dehydrogenase